MHDRGMACPCLTPRGAPSFPSSERCDRGCCCSTAAADDELRPSLQHSSGRLHAHPLTTRAWPAASCQHSCHADVSSTCPAVQLAYRIANLWARQTACYCLNAVLRRCQQFTEHFQISTPSLPALHTQLITHEVSKHWQSRLSLITASWATASCQRGLA